MTTPKDILHWHVLGGNALPALCNLRPEMADELRELYEEFGEKLKELEKKHEQSRTA